jgi:hypothetical protein
MPVLRQGTDTIPILHEIINRNIETPKINLKASIKLCNHHQKFQHFL